MGMGMEWDFRGAGLPVAGLPERGRGVWGQGLGVGRGFRE